MEQEAKTLYFATPVFPPKKRILKNLNEKQRGNFTKNLTNEKAHCASKLLMWVIQSKQSILQKDNASEPALSSTKEILQWIMQKAVFNI